LEQFTCATGIQENGSRLFSSASSASSAVNELVNQKRRVVDAARPAEKIRRPQKNPNLNAQTRKVLGQHYRAKYGVNGKR